MKARDINEIEVNEREFEDQLNELYGAVEICGIMFDQGTALKELDPTAFRCAMADEPLRYSCGDCLEEFDDLDDANDHWDSNHAELEETV